MKVTGRQIYANVDEKALLATADATLLNFGTSFFPSVITHANGIYIYTADGKRILDWTSGQMSCLIGHGHEEVVKTIHEHASSLDHLFSGMISPPVIQLAKMLTDLTGPGLDRALFLSTGSECNEAAIKLAKFYTGKWEIVGLSASWHGMTGASVGAQYHSGRKGYGPQVSFAHVQRCEARGLTSDSDAWKLCTSCSKRIQIALPPCRWIV